MTDFLDMFTNRDQFNTGSFQDNSNLLKKSLRDGDNVFRIVGKGKYFFIHRFDAINGVRVMSVCTKDEDGNGECEVCKAYHGAWKIVNDNRKAQENGEQSKYDPEVVRKAEIVAGERVNPIIGFKQSWVARKYIALNVIDRESDVNFKEKHTSILCKNKYELGISAGQRGIYEEIVKLLNRNRDEIKQFFSTGVDYLPFDIRLIKEGKGINTSYDKERAETRNLTPEELALERYDFDSIIKPTDANVVHRWLTVGTKKKEGEQASQPVQQAVQPVQQPVQQPAQQPQTELDKEIQQNVFPVQQQSQPSPVQTSGGFKPKEPVQQQPVQQQQPVEMDCCPSCDKMIPITSTKCQFCGTEFEGYTPDVAQEVAQPVQQPVQQAQQQQAQQQQSQEQRRTSPAPF